MQLIDYILIVVLILVIGSVLYYIRKQKKKGTVCIGCPHAGSCQSKGNCGSKKQ
ncbi:MAG: FeoB-associated Cys-rich membrane protein [Agathobacter sp.]|nr:FeoB-associated Cys-rich membrane protein [Agathobacter sp.]